MIEDNQKKKINKNIVFSVVVVTSGDGLSADTTYVIQQINNKN